MALEIKQRCPWAKSDLAISYHDEEWGAPLHDDRKLFEFLALEGAQAGLSWETILRKRVAYRVAFDNFDVEKVAAYDEARVTALLADAGIIRNRLKIESAIKNARVALAIREEFGSLDAYLWRFVGGQPRRNAWHTLGEAPTSTPESDALSKDLRKRGCSFVGTTIMYAYMQATGMVNDHVVACFRHDEV